MSDLEKSDSKGDNPDKLLTALEAIADSYKDPHGFVFAKKPESNLNPYNEKIEFQKLTPIVLENLPKGYKDALDFVFDNKTNPDVTNIAVTGSYGSGKTSIIKSYEDHFHKKSTGKEFTYISLASFDMPPNNACDLKENNSTKDETNFNTSLHHLEEKVINHLVHQISPEQIPLSRFKIYRTSSNKNAIYIAIYSILLLVTSYLVNDWIINKNHLENSHFSTILTAPIFPWFTPIALFFPLFLFLKLSWLVLFGWLTLLGFGIYYLVTNLQNYRVRKKLALGGSEIELFDEPNDSRFDKYMNEIIYIFEKAKIETVIIEDLDRFDKCSPHLFTRLRELNLLLNKRRAKKEEPIRFLYLIRDDIFTTENRTKFFDFILPVIPVITYQNSFEKAFELFTKSPYYFKDCDTPGIDERFLEIICPYIKDLRVIKNIYNEFHIYYQPIVIKAKLIPTKLLAIIAYKNLFPKDFSDLLNNKGFLYEIFNTPLPKAKDLTEKEILEGFIKNNFSSMTCEKLENQLDALTAVTLSKSQNYKLADPPFEITKHYIKKLRKLDKVWYIDARTGLITSTSFSNFCRLLGTEFDDFDSSVDQLEKKIEEHRNFNYSMLKHYHKEVETIPTLLIAHEVTLEFVKNIYQNQKSQLPPELTINNITTLFHTFIKYQYIDKTYPEYLTYFYSVRLNEDDKIFLRSFDTQTPLPSEYRLTDIKSIISNLNSSLFLRREILNINLLNYLLEFPDRYRVHLHYFLETMDDVWNIAFILNYFYSLASNTKKFALLFNNLNSNCEGIFDYFLTDDNIPNDLKSDVLILLLNQLPKPYIIRKENQSLINFIEKTPEFLQRLNRSFSNSDYIFFHLKIFNIIFSDISILPPESKLIDKIYSQNLYEFNINNILFLMKREFKKEFKDEELLSQNYTLLSRIPDSPLYEQVHSQIGRYMVELLKNDISFTDSPEARAKLLTNPNLAFKHKMDYIQKLATTHRELSPIIWNSLFEEYYKVPEKYNSDLHKYQKQFENICNSDKYRQQLLELGLKLEPKS